MENFCECYHCPIRHPSLMAQSIDMAAYRIAIHDLYHSHTSNGVDADQLGYSLTAGDEARADDYGGWLLWPNICFEVYPGGYMNTFHNIPLTPELTLQNCDWYFPQAEPTQEQEEAAKFVDTVREEDVSIVESVQRGYHRPGLRAGPFHRRRRTDRVERTRGPPLPDAGQDGARRLRNGAARE